MRINNDKIKRKSYYFSLGRNAIAVVLRIINLSSEDEVLTPAWDCDGTLQPFNNIGCRLKFYKINPYTFEVDLEHIRSLITPKTKLLHIINYFGIPQNWDLILEIKNQTSLFVLEDNAYSLQSYYNGKPLGSFGDFAIFSLRKCLPIPDGGVLVNNSTIKVTIFDRTSSFLYKVDTKKAINLLLQPVKNIIIYSNIYNRFKPSQKSKDYLFPLFSNSNEIPDGDRNHISNEYYYRQERPISKFSKILLSTHRKRKIAKLKNDYLSKYRYIIDHTIGIEGIKVLCDRIDDDVMPYCVFLLTNNRDELFYNLYSKNYPVMVWPSLPQQVLDNLKEFPEVVLLGKNLIQINIKRYLSKNYYSNLINDLVEFSKCSK